MMQSSRSNGNGGIQFVNETENIIRDSLGPELYDLQNAKRTGSDAGFDESDSETEVVRVPAGPPNGPKPGKKTKGRVKIRMEFIENKLRRYTTFSKRKTGIMKKAYELSTLTGTQVMLLVASETGHVYTFATRKLQPMITSESGKALIQTCLNSPDNPPLSSGGGNDQRMNPTGFEETELSYAITEDESQKSPDSGPRLQYVGSSMSRESSATPPESMVPLNLQTSAPPSGQGQSSASKPKQTIAMTTYLNPTVSSPAPKQNTAQPGNISMQLPTGGIATLLPPASLQPGAPIAVNAVPTGQQGVAGQQQAAPQAIYRIPTGPGGQMGQLVSIPGLGQTNASAASHQAPKPAETPPQSSSAAAATNPQQPVAMVTGAGTVVYQTPQGMMYAAPSSLGGIPEGYVLNLPQTPTLVPQNQEQGGATQQYITIPVPVSLAAGQQMFQPILTPTATTGDTSADDKKMKS